MNRLARLDHLLAVACRLTAATAAALAALVICAEWLFRQLVNRNVEHAVLEPAAWVLAVGGLASVAALPWDDLAGWRRWMGASARFALYAIVVTGAVTLDFAEARSAFRPHWSLQAPVLILACVAVAGAVRVLVRLMSPPGSHGA